MNILITGCSRGIGREFLERYVKSPESKKVFALTQNADELKALQSAYPGKLIVAPISVSDENAIPKIRELLGNESLDLLINNAGMYPKENLDFEKMDMAPFRTGFDVNVLAAIRTTQACVPALKKAKHAKVISVSSLMGSIADNGSGGSYAYRISKTALNMFNKCFAIDYPEFTSIVVHPGWVKTKMGGDNAPTEIHESVSGLMQVIGKITPKDTGKFFDFEGDELPW